MGRCIELARLGAGNVAPNPMVGAVLVYNDEIIGEGYHEHYGSWHAEVNCINSVVAENKSLISKSTIYVSLEPCSHYGKTPPCADLIITNQIRKVVIGCMDVNAKVAGRGIKKLQDAGLEVVSGVLEKQCMDLNKRFFTFHLMNRPYVILKWAQSENGKIGSLNSKRIFISNDYSNRVTHKWRSEEAAILIGTNTALSDDPVLTTRLWDGSNPVRVVIDKELKLPASLKIFNNESDTIIFNSFKNEKIGNCNYIQIEGTDFIGEILNELFNLNILSVIIEGGSKTLQSFIDKGLWDEARVITSTGMLIEKGIDAPQLKNFSLMKKENYSDDSISYLKKNN
jgi:diaminohydroxyphosphoribosylaminopyrimidine deaminase/5-amino-6-(5-phosphoribosylamino)uracil reductase